MTIPTPSLDGTSFPRLSARTLRFTCGAPRGMQVSEDGTLVTFLRSDSGTSRSASLWVLDVASGAERLVADPALLLQGDETLSAAERARRERLREAGAGITGYATDAGSTLAAFALSSRLFVADLRGAGAVRELPAPGPVIDPRPSPDGSQVAFAADGALHVGAVDGSGWSTLAAPDGPDVTFGLADFIASEELERFRGFWWSPDSRSLLVARVDESAVPLWTIADPANPSAAATTHRYPAAGTTNADVSLWLVPLDGTRREVAWDRAAFPYLVTVHWSDRGAPLVQVLSRRQERSLVLEVELATGGTHPRRELADPCWVDVVRGVPAWWGDRLLTVEVADDRYALHADGEPLAAPDVQVRAVLSVERDLLVLATEGLGEQHVYRVPSEIGAAWERLSDGAGVHLGGGAGGTLVLSSMPLDDPTTTVTVRTGEGASLPVRSLAVDPPLRPAAAIFRAGERGIPTAVLFPTDWEPGEPALPVLLNPYGGPHHSEVWASAKVHLQSQWWADQGFVVIVADNRGTPGSPSWERAVRFDLATPVIEDQVDALAHVADAYPGALDLDRVAVRGWSFGGHLAPVSDQALYDTAYTERYLGLPQEHPEAYAVSSALTDAASLRRPLMIIHGLADDNVVAAHSLRLSSALLAAGRPHEFLPLSGVTHMTPQEVVAENLLLLQLDFLRRALG
jgi:dipeptidyl-peptidase-4